ncbi:MAG: excinuclease ABC subunit UvrB [Candidatus Neomarinimicrobiota bacterium]|nr:excinuclease ABC subunit UvrB [Candidatus Neomarinimicrobiota bacterium]
MCKLAIMADFNIVSNFTPKGDQPTAISEITKSINNGDDYTTLLGVTGSGKTFTMANVIESVQRPTLVMSHNKTLAAQLYGELKQLFPNNAVEYFISYYDYYQPEAYLPVTDTYIEKDASINDEIDKLRLKTTSSLMARKDVIVVSSVSCIYGLGAPDEYIKGSVKVNVGESLDRRKLLSDLVHIHYSRNDQVLERGNVRVLGDIIEIFPAYEDLCVRIELFGTKIDKICKFDYLTGDIKEELDTFVIFPAKHFIADKEKTLKVIEHIKAELSDQLDLLRSNNKLLEAQRLEQRTNFDIEMMIELGYCSGIENYSRFFSGRGKGEKPFTLIDFFPDNYLTILDESHATLPQIRAMYKGDRSRKESLVEHGFRLPSALDNRPLKYEEFIQAQNQIIFMSATPSDTELEFCRGAVVEQLLRPTGLLDPIVEVRNTTGQIDNLIGEIRKRVKNQERVLVTTLTKRMAEDLTDYLSGLSIRVRYLHSDIISLERVKILRGLRIGSFDVLIGINLLREGLDLPEVSLVAVIDADKEGFLRSKSSLLQVAGRAARNVDGTVILYGDKITGAMKNLIDETSRRRELQNRYNLKNNITPQSIRKSVDEIMLTTSVAGSADEEPFAISEEINFNKMNEDEREMILLELRKEMIQSAERLEFEKAAKIRDEIDNIEQNIELVVS